MPRRTISPPVLTGRSIGNVKAHNLRAVLLTLLHNGPTSRVRLAQLTGLSTTTITNLISELLALGIVTESGREVLENRDVGERNASGRPATPISIVPAARSAVGIHFGVDTLRAGITDLSAI